MICQHSPDPSTSRHLSDGWRSVSGCSPAESCHGARPGAGLRALAPFLSLSSRGRGLKEPLSRGHPVPVAAGASLSKNRLGDVCAVLPWPTRPRPHIPSVAHKSWWEGAGSGRLCRPSALPTACGVGIAPAAWSRLGAVWDSISWPVHPAAATAVGTTSVMGDVTCFTQGRFSKLSGLGWSLILVLLLS